MAELLTDTYQPKISLEKGKEEYANLHHIVKNEGILNPSYSFFFFFVKFIALSYVEI